MGRWLSKKSKADYPNLRSYILMLFPVMNSSRGSTRKAVRKLALRRAGTALRLGWIVVSLVLWAGSPGLRAQADLDFKPAMVAPPVVTMIGPASGAFIPVGGRLVEPTNAVFRFSGARAEQWDASYPHQFLWWAGASRAPMP